MPLNRNDICSIFFYFGAACNHLSASSGPNLERAWSNQSAFGAPRGLFLILSWSGAELMPNPTRPQSSHERARLRLLSNVGSAHSCLNLEVGSTAFRLNLRANLALR